MRWQRPVRLLLGLFVLVFGIGVYLSIDRRQPRPDVPAQLRQDPNAVVESTKGQSILHRGAKQDVRIDYDRLATYATGRMVFHGAKVAVLERAGRNIEIGAREAEVAENQSQIDLRGDVVMKTSDGLTVKTDKAVYTESDQVVRAPGAVSFARDRMTGSSVGASYDQVRDVLWLLDQARITTAPDAQGQGASTVTAGAAGYARRDRYVRFDRGVQLVRGAQAVRADGAVAYLAADADRLEMLELRGNGRVAGVGQGANGLEAMEARDMNLDYGPDGQLLESAVLVGNAVLQLAGGEGKPGQRLAGQSIEITLAPDGQTVQTLAAQDAVQLDLPASGAAAARRIRSGSLDARGEPGAAGLRHARFVDKVEFRETIPATKTAPASERIVRARLLEARLESGLASIDEATFTGDVTVQDGDRTASSPTMVYAVAKGAIRLTTPEGQDKVFARVNDPRVSVEARAIDWTTDGGQMVADGRVKSVLKPGGGAAGAGDEVKRPAMLSGDQPVNVTAAKMTYASSGGKAEYAGDSQLWQGQTSIKADTIALDEKSGNLTASGNVRSVMRVESSQPARSGTNGSSAGRSTSPAAGAPAATQPAATPPVKTPPGTPGRQTTEAIATSADLVYDDAARKATYSTDARLVGAKGDLRAARIEVFFDQTGKALERLEAYENVKLKSPAQQGVGARYGEGARLTYFAADERYVLAGPRAHVAEQMGQECRDTTGRTLTFFNGSDTLLVDGNQHSRTQARTGGKCPELVP
jgi:lipopolysaccharide export system protein LptA